ncbi:COP9 signalosome complex subunit 7 [Hibiscus syriacus]|uniref:COP9 signalosome complex subunit 7 n=1 Tax=Hibiscus syriacus TaxID=106335 RepID=A0A6A2Y0S8_HIBSY|nr:COP9 signalosome complex subunit 7 [Hibiscus syriacus]
MTSDSSTVGPIIVEATSHPSLFAFSEILAVPAVVELEGTDNSMHLEVLRLFAHGTWSDYKRNNGRLPQLVPDQVLELKQLTVLTLAETNKVLSYDHAKGGKCIAFTQTKRDADRLTYAMSRNFKCEALHGDITQARREATLSGFRNGHFNILVATNVAARGLDIPSVDLVIHYPNTSETFVHRTGRVECIRWVTESVDTKEMDASDREGNYVCVVGHLKSFQGKVQLNVFSVRYSLNFPFSSMF